MTQLNAETCAKLDRMAEITRVLAQIIDSRRPGEYRFETDYPAEHRKFLRIATQFRSIGNPELNTYGFRAQVVLRELAETDRTYRTAWIESRAARKQMALLVKAVGKFREAAERLSAAEERGELTYELRPGCETKVNG
ncbi:hypothetical protein [Paenibacillus sp. SI8]|uniref:hypothetical protein n=1 Tax=unclassified Paenibacillus TaxID=185978 RepID=UPI0034655038